MSRLTILFAALLLSSPFVLALAHAGVLDSGLEVRQHDGHAGDTHPQIPDMDMDSHMAENTRPEPSMHEHGEHEAAKDVLDESDMHNEWHTFPPTYLAADFRLDNDTAIFGEEFDEDWDPDNSSGHKLLMMAHVGAMVAAYFAVLPICE